MTALACRSAVRLFYRHLALIAGATARLPHLGAGARKWGSGLTGMPSLKLYVSTSFAAGLFLLHEDLLLQ